MRASKYTVLVGLLLLATGCPADAEPGKPNPFDMSQAGRAPGKPFGQAGKSGSLGAGRGAAGAAGSEEEPEEPEDLPIAGKGGSGGNVAAGRAGAGGKAGSPAAGSGGAAGKAGSPAAGGSGAAGKGGSPAAGSGGRAAPASGVDGSTKLGEIKSDAQAQALCDQLVAQVPRSDFDTLARGNCALQGLSGELQGLGECAKLTQACLAEGTDFSEDCTLGDFPSCPDVTVAEFLACSKANIAASVAFFGKLTCDSDLTELSEPPTPAACEAVYKKCPELQEGSDDEGS